MSEIHTPARFSCAAVAAVGKTKNFQHLSAGGAATRTESLAAAQNKRFYSYTYRWFIMYIVSNLHTPVPNTHNIT